MNFDLSSEHVLLRETVRQFALEKVAPIAEELDRDKRFPYELVAELAELGLMGMTIPEEYGGAGTDTLSYAITIEESRRASTRRWRSPSLRTTSLGTLPRSTTSATSDRSASGCPTSPPAVSWPHSG